MHNDSCHVLEDTTVFNNERHEGDLGGLQCGVTIDPELEILSRPILRPKELDTSQGQKNRPREECSLVDATTPSWINSNTTYQAVPAASLLHILSEE